MKSFLTFVLFLSLSVFTNMAAAQDSSKSESVSGYSVDYGDYSVDYGDYQSSEESFRSSLAVADKSLYIHTCVYVVKVFDSRTMYSFEFVSRQKLSTSEVLNEVLGMLGEATKIIRVMAPSCSIE